MVTSNQAQGGGVILLTIIVAVVVMLIPMSEGLRAVRPEWLLLTLMYWALALPYRMGVGYAWFVGLLMDVLTGGPLGVLAFSYALVIYLVLHFHLQNFVNFSYDPVPFFSLSLYLYDYSL